MLRLILSIVLRLTRQKPASPPAYVRDRTSQIELVAALVKLRPCALRRRNEALSISRLESYER